ncbi:hypothetical protein [Hymenobacter volaticus]|uniref:Uncharacterized protein n=1 Tax=Hymenobacter volaticus TaxID=2932254 RepID=A0ABY4G1E0_9BACT|nr:hypothetical protein [Hymenobacter volaticus]UOQ64679.1 hypothetical protein MUN86_13975 [Hymenobacter volaticus]
MKTPFRLDEHPRRPQPLAPPPDGYFDRLPMQIMQRVQPASPATSWTDLRWLTALSAPMRTALAAGVVLSGFVGSFLLSENSLTPSTATNLAAVPRTEMVEYLLVSELPVTLTDLAELPVTEQTLPETSLHVSPDELQEVLDTQPTEDIYL